MRRGLALAVLVALFSVWGGRDSVGLASPAPSELGVTQEAGLGPTTREVRLYAGWNLVGWTGSTVDTAAITGQLNGVFDSLHAFDAGRQRFDVVTATGPDFLNSLVEVGAGEGLWIFSRGDTLWTQPVIREARAVALSTGFNLVTWTGAHGIAIGEALASLGEALQIAFTYDELDEAFLSYGPSLPPFLNSAEFLAYGEAMWVRVNQPVMWEQPAPPPGGVFVSADGRATVTVPVGSSGELVVEAIAAGELPESIDGQTVLSGYTVTNIAAGVAGLGVAQVVGFPVEASFDVETEIDPGEVVVVWMFFDPNLDLVTPNPAEPGAFKRLRNQGTTVNASVNHMGVIGWGQATLVKEVFLTQDPGGISGSAAFEVTATVFIDAEGRVVADIAGIYLGAGTSPQVSAGVSRGAAAGDFLSPFRPPSDQSLLTGRVFGGGRTSRLDVEPGEGVAIRRDLGSCEDLAERFEDAFPYLFAVTEPADKRGEDSTPVDSLPTRHVLHGSLSNPCTPPSPEFITLRDDNFDTYLDSPARASDPDFLARNGGLVDIMGFAVAPIFEEQSLGDLLDLFPEGMYSFRGADAGGRLEADELPFDPVELPFVGFDPIMPPGLNDLRAAQSGGATFVVVAFEVVDDIPQASEDLFFVYAAVFDRDGNPDNNFVPLPQFPLDYFGNTDMWYELRYSPVTEEWALSRRIVIGGTPRVFPTDAVVLFAGDVIYFFIPRSDFSVGSGEDLLYRVTAFTYDRSDPFGFGMNLSAGDTAPFVLDPLAILPLP